ncbi:MAG TPA: tetratricopeptide repeat protein [Xanthobacteraceae bacterium]
MRWSDLALSIGLLGLAVGLSPAVSFDGSRTPEGAAVSVPLSENPSSPEMNALGGATPLAPVPLSPMNLPPRPVVPGKPIEAFRSGTHALRQGRTDQAVVELEYAAEQGVPGAIWKLGRMYADGDGVAMNKARAFGYFRRLTTAYAEDSAGTPDATYVAKGFIALGHYYADGIPGSVKPDLNHAREMFEYAASYFGDAEAQYDLGRSYLLAKGSQKNPVLAAKWLRLSAEKGDARAQALLGNMLFKGEEVSRQAAWGLFWLILAKDGAGSEETWITDMYTSALARADENERTQAYKYLERWLKRR